MYQRRVVGSVLALAAIVAILTAALSRTWWRSHDEVRSTSVGLRSVERCDRDLDYAAVDPRGDVRPRPACRELGLRAWVRGELVTTPRRYYAYRGPPMPGAFLLLGAATFVAAFAAAVALAAAIGAARWAPRGAGPRVLGTIAAIACGAVAALAIGWLIAAPPLLEPLRAGLGPVLALVGAAAGAAGALVLRRSEPGADPPGPWLRAAVHAVPGARRATGVVAGVAGAALVVTAISTNTWLRGDEEALSIRAGLVTYEVCRRPQDPGDTWSNYRFAGGCTAGTVPADPGMTDQPARMRLFLSAGAATWSAGVVAALATGLAALLVLLGQPVGGALAIGRVLVIAGGAFATGAVAYVAARPHDVRELGVHLGPFVALAGAGGVIAAGVLLGRWTKAVDAALAAIRAAAPPRPPDAAPPEALAAAPAASVPGGEVVAIPPCPACATPMLWVRARDAWLCTVCRTRPAAADA